MLSLALPIGLYVRAVDAEEVALARPTFDPGYSALRDDFESARTEYQASYAVPAGLAGLTLALLVVNVVDASNDEIARMAIGPGPAGSLGLRVGWAR